MTKSNQAGVITNLNDARSASELGGSIAGLSKAEMDMLFDTAAAQDALYIRNEVGVLGKLLADSRISAGMSQQQLSKRAGVARATVANIESGILPNGPQFLTFFKLLKACGKILSVTLVDLEDHAENSDCKDRSSAHLKVV